MKLRASWMRSLEGFGRRRRDRDLAAELESHLQMHADDNLRTGMPPAEARRLARVRLGGVEQVQELCRERRGWPELEACVHDLRHAARRLRRSPGFALVVALLLALGIGANTAIFTLLDGLLLRPLPVRDPQHLLLVRWHARAFPNYAEGFSYSNDCQVALTPGQASGCAFSAPFFEQLRSAPLFKNLAAFADAGTLDLSFAGQASVAGGEFVSGNYFSTLGVRPALGRLLQPGDDAPGAPPVVVLSAAYWRRAWGGSPRVLGRTIRINRLVGTVVGVAEPGFTRLAPGEGCDLWLPLALRPNIIPRYNPAWNGPGFAYLVLVGRLAPRVSPATAAAQSSLLWTRAASAGLHPPLGPRDAPGISLPSVQDGLSGSRATYSHPLELLMAGVGLILLIVCANVAGLLAARSAVRQPEMALRRALGASRMRLARQTLAESLLLSGLGGAAGILLAYAAARAIAAMIEANVPNPLGWTPTLDVRILLFTAAVTIATGVLSGLVPARAAAALVPRPRRRLGRILVVAQVALSLVLLAGAGLLARTLRNLERTPPGFDVLNLVTFDIAPGRLGYQGSALRTLYLQLQDRLAAIPGVQAAGFSSPPLLNPWVQGYSLAGLARPGGGVVHAQVLDVSPNYLATLRVPLLAGRDFAPADFANAANPPAPVIVNRLFVERYFGAGTPLEQAVGAEAMGTGRRQSGFRIIGVVGDAKFVSLRAPLAPTLYGAGLGGGVSFALRTPLPPAVLLPAVRRAVAQADPDLPIAHFATQAENTAQLLFQERLLARLAAAFGFLALLLACLGLYGLLAHEVAQRQREFGIRMALGASTRDVIGGVARLGLGLTALGLVAGCGLALAVLRLLASILYGVRPADPGTLLGASALLLGIAILAGWRPAQRALCSPVADLLRSD